MTATERLRALLDERGVEHYDGTETTLWLKDGVGYRASADEGLSGFVHLHLWCTTPEQAVEATLGRDRYSYAQWREISDAVGDAMEYAHDRAIECPDKADPLWNLDEYVNRILKVAFEGEATLGRGECELVATYRHDYEYGYAGTEYEHVLSCGDKVWWSSDDAPEWCPWCGRRVRA